MRQVQERTTMYLDSTLDHGLLAFDVSQTLMTQMVECKMYENAKGAKIKAVQEMFRKLKVKCLSVMAQ